MIVQCDKCKAKFQLADDRITEKGVKVRCSKCKSVFTVKKSADQTEEPRAPAPPPASDATPVSAPSPESKEEDPFTDFNFSDDMDFGAEEEISVEASPKPSPGKPQPDLGPSFLDETPGAPIPSNDQAGGQEEQASSSDEGFDFSEDDFSFADEPEAPSQAPPKENDFEDFKLDADSFADSTPAPEQSPPPPGDEDFGNVSFSDETPEMPSQPGPGAGIGSPPIRFSNWISLPERKPFTICMCVRRLYFRSEGRSYPTGRSDPGAIPS